jgi:hypothetical protein
MKAPCIHARDEKPAPSGGKSLPEALFYLGEKTLDREEQMFYTFSREAGPF